MSTAIESRGLHAAGSTTPPGKPIAVVENLAVTFRRRGVEVPALRGVSLELKRGEILGLVGESGSGKSVLGLTLLGLLPSTPSPTISGSVQVCGVDMVHSRDKDRRHLRSASLGAIFQDPMTSLNPTMRVGVQLIESCGSNTEAIRLLDDVGVPEPKRRLRSFPHELSGGLRQRVMIAMAIGGQRELVVADEPTTALDVTVQAQILEMIRHLRDQRGTTFLFVTHDLGVAAQVADRIAVLYGGRLAELGPASDVLLDPLQPYTAALVRSRITMDVARDRPLPTIAGEVPDPRLPPPGCPFAPRCPHHENACDAEVPEMRPASPERFVACVRLGDRTLSPTQQPTPLALRPSSQVCPVIPGPVIELIGAHKSFPIRRRGSGSDVLHALQGVNLSVGPGESVALVGESGCGKSTLLRLVAGFLEPDKGTVTVRAENRPQMVFQDARASLTPWLTVGELVADRLRGQDLTRAERTKRVVETLQIVGLPTEVATAKPAQLSGGQCQRVGLARAIAVPPSALLCDEPTSALDVSLAATVLNLLGRLRREFDMAMIFVTHDLAAARVIADSIAVMYLGRIVEEGPAELVTSAPVHPYTKDLLSAVPGTGRIGPVRARGEVASPIDLPSGCAYHTRCTEAVATCASETPAMVPVSPQHHHACLVHQGLDLSLDRAGAE